MAFMNKQYVFKIDKNNIFWSDNYDEMIFFIHAVELIANDILCNRKKLTIKQVISFLNIEKFDEKKETENGKYFIGWDLNQKRKRYVKIDITHLFDETYSITVYAIKIPLKYEHDISSYDEMIESIKQKIKEETKDELKEYINEIIKQYDSKIDEGD